VEQPPTLQGVERDPEANALNALVVTDQGLAISVVILEMRTERIVERKGKIQLRRGSIIVTAEIIENRASTA